MLLPIHIPKKFVTPLVIIFFTVLVSCDIWRATPPVAAQAEDLFFTISDEHTTGEPGETTTYKVTIKNQSNRELNDLKITVLIPDYLVPVATSPAAAAHTENRTLTWASQKLSAKSERIYGIQAKIAEETPLETTLQVTTQLEGSEINRKASDSTTVRKTVPFKIADKAAITTAPTPQPPVAPSAQTGPASLALLIISTLTGAVFTLMFSVQLAQRNQ